MDSKNKGTFIRERLSWFEILNRLRTKNILVFLKDRGIILNEPSLVALDGVMATIAVCERAYQWWSKIKEINVHHPLKGGVTVISRLLSNYLNYL